MMRHALLIVGLVASVASAQTPAASSEAIQDSTVIVEAIVLERSEARVVDSVDVRAPREAPVRHARLAFPTEGGVFYYRAGSGSAIRRVQRPQPDAPAQPARSDSQLAERQLDASPQVTSGSAGTGRAGDPPVRPSEVTQRDLDRLERRLMDALNQREVRSRPPAPVPIVIPPARSGDERPVERPTVTGVPVSPADTLRPVVRAPLVDDPGVNTDPEVTPEVVERAILDTGLFRTSRVFFAFGEADLLPVSRRVLDTIAEVLLRYPELRIEVGGHTDAISSDAFNLELSQRRAGSVTAYLIARGIDARQITAVGYGEARPVATNETETGRALNRRVEFVVLGE
ncbi:MAG: hypothetical protein Rubg2KO_31510 [Rubricoccaceae bacterium]